MAMTETIQILKSVPLFRSLVPEELERISNIVIQRTFPKKTVIFIEGSEKEAVFFIRSGLVKTYKTDENGHEQIVSFLKEGDMFPHIGLFNKNPYPATAETIVDTVLLAIPVHQFEHLLLDMPSIAVKALGVLGEKIRELQEKIQEMSGQDVNQRAVSLLVKLAEQHVVNKNGHIHIELPLTHQEFANTVGTSRETINRLLNHLRKEKIIDVERSRVIVLDLDALFQYKEVSKTHG
ncbi:MAG: Crp/Fnr family transcriptional regulator [Paenibacillaceae bacterium]|nr:Crp/Fnr family transcriptional regulator [Paenibacillaceae bacterium]